MYFDQELIPGYLLRRYQRFLADVRLEDGSVVTAHCANSGSMLSCLGQDWPVLLSRSDNPRRKLAYTCELIHNGETWIGINTQRTNHLVREAWQEGRIPELSGYNRMVGEIPLARQKRSDFFLFDDPHGVIPPTIKRSKLLPWVVEHDLPALFLEIKSVTLKMDGVFQFPDAVTRRGKEQLEEMMELTHSYATLKAGVLYLVQREDGDLFRPAESIDSAYAAQLQKARQEGLSIFVYQARMRPQGIFWGRRIPSHCF